MLRKCESANIFTLIYLPLILFIGFTLISPAYAEGKNPVDSIITVVNEGGRVDWTNDNKVIFYDTPGADGYYDLWSANIDGSDKQCLTCGRADLDQTNQHAGNPAIHPGNKYLIFQAVNPVLEIIPPVLKFNPKQNTSPGAGINNNLWCMDIESKETWQLTDVSAGQGIIHPHFSQDGKKVIWAEKIGLGEDAYGEWAIRIADFDTQTSTPYLTNLQTFKPGNFQQYEAHGFSPDGSKIIFSAFSFADESKTFDCFTYDLITKKLINLTESPDEWDEFAGFSPDGRKIAWVSTNDTPQERDKKGWIIKGKWKLDLWVMNMDGFDKQRLTHFNLNGYPEYDSSGITVADFSWGNDNNSFIAKVRVNSDEIMSGENIKLITLKNIVLVDDLRTIGKGCFPKWSPDGRLIAFTNESEDKKDQDGIGYEIYTMQPDGSDVKCLTCGKSALADTRWRGQPYWHPSGKYIVFTAETNKYPRKGIGSCARPGIGRNHNVWIMTSDGTNSWQITDYPDNWGVIRPSFSPDGKTLYWNEEFSMEKYPQGKPGDKKLPGDPPDTIGHPGSYWGYENFLYRQGEEAGAWRVKLADISFESEKPQIANIRHINPPEGFTLLEGTGFSPDGNSLIYSYANLAEIQVSEIQGDIYISDLQGILTKRLTKTLCLHDENPEFSPDGKNVLWNESQGEPGEGEELWLMDADGGNKIRLTYFSNPNHDEYDPLARQIPESGWSPDGKRIVFGHVSQEERGSAHIPSTLYILTLKDMSCDIDDNGEINISDIQACVNVILGIELNPKISDKAKKAAAPIEQCDLLDVQKIVNVLLEI